MRSVVRLIVLGLIVSVAGCAGAPSAGTETVEALFDVFFIAESSDEVEAAIAALLASPVDAPAIADRLRAGPTHDDDVPSGWTVSQVMCADGRARPYQVFVPASYDATSPAQLLFDLHGAVIGPGYTVEELAGRRGLWEPTAEAMGMILVMPHGDRAASWWSAIGHGMLRDQLAAMKRRLSIDENRIFLSGFSDGGSGAIWMAFHDPTPWAGFISLMGNPTIARMGPYPCYQGNLHNRPIRMASGAYDPLYPAAELKPIVDQLARLGVRLEWTVYAVGHDLTFFPTEREFSERFLDRVERDPLRRSLVWETAVPTTGRCDWIVIEQIGRIGNDADIDGVSVWDLSVGQDFGVGVGSEVEEGLIIAGISPGSAAHRVGLRAGDILVRVNERPIRTAVDLREATRGIAAGVAVEAEILRAQETVVLTGTAPEPEPVFPHPEASGTLRARVEGNRIDVEVRHVVRYTLLLSSAMLDLDAAIQVFTNGDLSYEGKLDLDRRGMLEQAAADRDRQAVYEARLEIRVPPGSASL
jgi:hypothetical protein